MCLVLQLGPIHVNGAEHPVTGEVLFVNRKRPCFSNPGQLLLASLVRCPHSSPEDFRMIWS